VRGGQPAALGASTRRQFGPEGGVIGRATICDWVLPHAKVSARHAIISFVDGNFYLEDKSTNGVFINQRRERLVRGRPHPLQSGDSIFIDPYDIRVTISDDAMSTPRRPPSAWDSDPFQSTGIPSRSRGAQDPFGGDPFAAAPLPPGGGVRPDLGVSAEAAADGELDPLKLIGGPAGSSTPRPQPKRKDLEAGSSLDAHYTPPAIRTPPPAPAPSPFGLEIPEDYNPLDDSGIQPIEPRVGRITSSAPAAPSSAASIPVAPIPSATPPVAPLPVTPLSVAPVPVEAIADVELIPEPAADEPAVAEAAISEAAIPDAPVSQTPASSDSLFGIFGITAAPAGAQGTKADPFADLFDELSHLESPGGASDEPAAAPAEAAVASEGDLLELTPPPELSELPSELFEAPPLSKSTPPPRPAARATPPPAPVPAPARDEVASEPLAPPPQREPAAAPGGYRSTVDLAAVLEGAGLKNVEVSEELARDFGRILQVVVSGVMEVLRARQQIKDEFRMRMTQFRPAENNPLKFSANVEDALHNLLVKRNAAYLQPVDAFEDAFNDLTGHQLAMLAGMRAAFDAMLEEFGPDRLQEQFDRQLKKGALLTVPAKLRYWDLYRSHCETLLKDAESTFRNLFREPFAEAYEEQLNRLKAERRSRRRDA
jgi:type VI secretion system FHA domain protein